MCVCVCVCMCMYVCMYYRVIKILSAPDDCTVIVRCTETF